MSINKVSPSMIEQYLRNNKNLTILNGKIPTTNNWTNKKITKDKILNHDGNIGWVLDYGDLVVDVDPRNGGKESFKRLLSDLSIKLIPTVNTPSGGFHCYLKMPTTDIKLNKILKKYPGIDFLTKGTQCVIVGSKTEIGKYSWSKDNFLDDFEQLDAPEKLIKLLSNNLNSTKDEDLKNFDDLISDKKYSNLSEKEVLDILAELDPSMKNDDWVKVGMALHNWDEKRGLKLWEKWSKGGNNYKEGETAKRWKSFKSGGGITLGTIIHMSKQMNGIIEWEPPILFDEYEIPEIKSSILPSPLKEFAIAISKSAETPEAMASMCVIAVLSTALQGKFEVKPRKDGEHKETLNIYTLTALPPANRKSAILKSCIYPLQEWEREQREILEPKIKKQKSCYESEKKIIDVMRKKLKFDNNSDLIKEIAKKESELKEPQILPRLFVNDTTPESLAIIVTEQNNRMSIFSDEGGIVDTMAGLYSGGNANIDIWLKGWDGGHFRQKRKDRDLDINPLLTINLVVQPVIIQNLGGKKVYNGKGLLERFLYCIPKSNLGYRTNNQDAISSQIKDNYNQKIRDLLNIPYQEKPTILVLEDEAYKKWREFQDAIEIELRPEGRLSICQGWGGKICGYALRIAGLFHIAEYGKDNTTINVNTIQKALELCSLLSYHAIAAFGVMEVDQDTKDAQEILRWIKECKLDFFAKANVTKKMQNRSSMNAIRIDKLLNILSQRNIISEPIKEGKKTILFKVNPAILSRDKCKETNRDII